ncbi:MAG: hypothetical protein Q8J78_10275 [Moraxellaceae bacterium]|nr:hypothetical protein [Moraxellaceae bacterium]
MRGVSALLLMSALASASAFASNGAAVSVKIGGDARWFDWREFRDGEQLLSEMGPQVLPAVRTEVALADFFAALDVQYGGGIAYYDGQLQNGTPYTSIAWEAVLDANWILGWREVRGEVTVGMLQRDWRRFIEGDAQVSSAEERYRWRIAVIGGEWRVWQSRDWEWRVSAQFGRPFERKEKVYFATGEDTVTLEPGQGNYVRIGLPLFPLQNPTLRIEPYYQQQDLARSEIVPMTQNGVFLGYGVFQPESVRREVGLALRWNLSL